MARENNDGKNNMKYCDNGNRMEKGVLNETL